LSREALAKWDRKFWKESILKNKLSQIISGPSQKLRSFGFYLARANMELNFKTILKFNKPAKNLQSKYLGGQVNNQISFLKLFRIILRSFERSEVGTH